LETSFSSKEDEIGKSQIEENEGRNTLENTEVLMAKTLSKTLIVVSRIACG